VNPSFQIVSRLPHSLPGIQIIAHLEPLTAAYRPLLETAPKLIEKHKPDIVLHVGLAVERDYFGVEQTAPRDGYHQNLDMDRKVITKAESKTLWGKKSPETLATSLDLEQTVALWKQKLQQNSRSLQGGKGPKTKQLEADVRLSNDVGNYVCGLVYYTSLAELARRNGGKANAVFLHVPPLSTEQDLERGCVVLVSLIEALAEVWENNSS
jgi:pyroglutamyl-peptidase